MFDGLVILVTVTDNPHAWTAFSAFVDLFLAIYPGVVLFKLQMSLRKKIALTSAFGLGAMYGNLTTDPFKCLEANKYDQSQCVCNCDGQMRSDQWSG